MFQCVSNVNCMEEEGKRGDEEVITVVIYKTAGGYGSEREDADTNSNLQTQRPVLWIKLNILTAERDQLKKHKKELQRFIQLGWILFSSSIYKISTEKKSWTESRQACRERGAELVIINSREEQDFINILRTSRKSWIGLNDRDREGEWKWVDDTPLIAEYWFSGEPNDKDEHCVITGEGSDPVRTWADYPCKSKFIWICEKTIFF
ncbi:CD209 antigen-like protein C isoform X2 [Silurus meridionalis]|uniref:CD209 antigen-like protein C isoform X2 n=1 Tax=Silurus meridionalis TaxID=175797 RepID=UPI001EECC9BE|nr:CD209 antigen-like protein C isoform X2 [Silurus meridionalis]